MIPEVASYLEVIEGLRTQVRDLIAGQSAEVLNWRPVSLQGLDDAESARPVPDTNSLAVLAAHTAGSEHFWIGEIVGGLDATRDRDAEFSTEASDATRLLSRLEAVAGETRAVLTVLAEENLDGERLVRGRTLSVRSCILHVIEHTALHLGHMQLTLQLKP